MNIANALVSPVSSFLSHIGTDTAENGVVGRGFLNRAVRLVYAHGIRTSEEECLREAAIISSVFKNSEVHYTYYTSSGSFGDIRRMANALFRQVPLVAAQKLAENIRLRLEELSETLPEKKARRVVVIAHSGGGILMNIACSVFLAAEERKKIVLYTFGSPVLFSNETVSHAVNYVSRSDYIPSFCTFLQGYFWNNPAPCVFIGSQWRNPFEAHAFAGKDYVDGLQEAKSDLKKVMQLQSRSSAKGEAKEKREKEPHLYREGKVDKYTEKEGAQQNDSVAQGTLQNQSEMVKLAHVEGDDHQNSG